MKDMKTIKVVSIESVKPYEKNAKKHDKAQVLKIAQSIREFGWDQPIVVDRDFVIIKGHGRRLAAIELGLKEVPVLVRDDLDAEQVRAARLADNRVAQSDYDLDLLKEELSAINLELLKGVFDDKELDFSLSELGAIADDAFVADIDVAVAEQDELQREKAKEIERRRVPIAAALKIKDIGGSNEIFAQRFIAKIEAESGLTGEDALVAHMKAHIER